MATAQSFANVTACRADLNPVCCRIVQRNIMFLPSQYWDIISMLFPWENTLPSHALLDLGVHEYLVGQRWQCV